MRPSKTAKGYKEQHSQLLSLAMQELPVGVHRYAQYAKGMDSDSFCAGLARASSHPVLSNIAGTRIPKGKSLQNII